MKRSFFRNHNLVPVAATGDLPQILFSTLGPTRKYSNILANQRVATVVDNRSNRASDFQKAVAATATGNR